jgi:ferredoxin/flavodoxin---NADP+ reductase
MANDAPGTSPHAAERRAQAEHEAVDITIIGGGPTGLFAMFYAGMRGATARIVDALPQVGGQLTALYPEKYIFDVAGYPKVLAKDFVHALASQANQFGHPTYLNQRVNALEHDGALFTLVTETDRFPSRALVIAAGIGAFSPRRLPHPFAQPWYGRGIYDVVLDPEEFRGRRVVIIGGGDSAFDWAHQLADRAAHVTLVHRTDRFRAHGATVRHVQAAAAAGRAEVLTFHELHDVVGSGPPADGARVKGVVLRDTKAKTTRSIETDAVLPMLGYVSDLGPLADWGLTLANDEIVVASTMETGRAGIYAAGDITTYAGKLKLIATGFGEAAVAVNQAVHWIYPAKKVAPAHSSNMALFGQTDD